MTPTAAVINSLNAKIEQMQDEIDTALARAVEAEKAWAAALVRERDAIERARVAEEELMHLQKELNEEAD